MLKKWIETSVAVTATVPAEEKEPARAFVSVADNLKAMHRHLSRTPRERRRFQRYFTFTHLHNNPAVASKDLGLPQAALAKLLNSLSWKAAIVVPQPVDAAQTIFVVDIRKLDWDRHRLWDEILRLYPTA